MSKAGACVLKQHEMKDLRENDDAIAQWCRDIYVAKHFWCCLVTCFPPVSYWTNILPKTLLEKKSCKTMPPNQIPCGSRILGMHSYLRTIKILQATALLSSWKGVAISAALIAVTVLMQILINFSKSERSTAAQGCIRKDKEYESGLEEMGRRTKHTNYDFHLIW
ncbi:hypothetical protein KY284_032831 [Solanum tuberosum]|nr:hypothetical protein KY284_032831 [Solanum tuberosum]